MSSIFTMTNGKITEIVKVDKIVGNYKEWLRYSDTFMETGSCMGRSIELALSAGYKKVYSVEAKEEYHEHCKKLFANNSNVHLYLGKSVDRIIDMLFEAEEKPLVFFLDAHVSGAASAGYLDWVENQKESDYDQDKVLKKEIEMILNHREDHIFIIDDQNGDPYYAHYIESLAPDKYKFELWDEQMGEIFYKNKMLIAIPK